MNEQAQLALGRILRMGSRPEQAGDKDEYERCRRLILDAVGSEHDRPVLEVCWVRDRLKGAQGD